MELKFPGDVIGYGEFEWGLCRDIDGYEICVWFICVLNNRWRVGIIGCCHGTGGWRREQQQLNALIPYNNEINKGTEEQRKLDMPPTTSH